MLTRTFTYTANGYNLHITVRTTTGRDYLTRQFIWMKTDALVQGELEFTLWLHFVRALLQSTIQGDLGFHWPSIADDGALLTLARNAWLDLPAELIETWVKALQDVDELPVDPELAPDVDAAKKKTNALPPSDTPPASG